MGIKKYLGIITNNLLLIAIVSIITTAIAAYVTLYKISSTYEASARMYIMKNGTNPEGQDLQYGDVTVIKQLVQDYQSILTSRMITDKVFKDLDIKDNEVNNIIKNISVNQQGSANIIQITVKDKNPNYAKNIAEKLTNVFIEKISDITTIKNIAVTCIDTPILPRSPVGPNKYLNIIIAFILSATASIGYVFMKEYFDTTIRTSQDIETYLGLKVIGTIPVKNIK